MTKRITTTEDHYWHVRVVLGGAVLYLASRTEPQVTIGPMSGKVCKVSADWLTDPGRGDTLAYIDWEAVDAITCRWSGETEAEKAGRP
jgi:hypothetical protein